MKTRLLIGIVLVLTMVTVVMAADDPFVGTWKINVSKSTFNPGPPPESVVQTITAQDNGYKIVSNGVDADGKPTHRDFILADLDGKDHSVSGNQNYDASMGRKVDANTIIGARKKDGKEVGNMRMVVSKDGKTLTVTMKGKNVKGEDINSTTVFNKQ